MKNRTIELFRRLRGERPGSVVERDGRTGMVDLHGDLIDMSEAPPEVRKEMTAHRRGLLAKNLICLGGLVFGVLVWAAYGIDVGFMLGVRSAIMTMAGALIAAVSVAGFFGR